MVADLAQRHDLVGSLIHLPTSSKDWDSYRITPEQIQFFQDNGYLPGIRLLDELQVDQLRKELDDLVNPDFEGNHLFHEYHRNESADPDRVLFHALGAWRIKPAFHDLLWNPAFTVPASQLLRGPVRFWHDQLFCKPAKHGGVVAWHQDYSYWTRTQPMNHLTCWIALDDSTWDNGCLQYLPGSHRWPLLPVTGLAGDMDAIRSVLGEEQMERFQHPVAVELKKGYATFHHPLLVHGSYANSTDRPRRATVINVFRDGTRSAVSEPLLKGANLVPAGEEMKGPFYPLLFDPAAHQS